MLIDDSFIYDLSSKCREGIAIIIKDAGVLNRLAEDESVSVRWFVAENPNTSPETLDRLSFDKQVTVRRIVAYNPNTLPETLDRLASDKYWEVRSFAVKNQNYKKPNTNQFTNEQLSALKTLIESASNPHLQELLKNAN